ncbi:carboxylesterase family protein [Microbacterium sp. QXD-8]|uniref:Carboxylesterase family protein n=1 Tax=Microbacterium psychrotolerans TaxID=3068321 RepID=A0ABU0Z683_9MICO|nr:carboxylesterase family protein [Microbacterium sp. QXD-8]MDQ7880089.1 carboxylesterase family protein [Microbacterium sp. QXD-8]
MTVPMPSAHGAGAVPDASALTSTSATATSFGAVDLRPVVQVAGGRVRGTREGALDRFLGIPYAAAPVGELRFREPQPAPAWEGERDAAAFGPTAPQAPYGGGLEKYLPTVEIAGDDILTVNVWTPADRPADAALPVLVFVHGGTDPWRGGPAGLRRADVRTARHRVRLGPVPARAGGLRGA